EILVTLFRDHDDVFIAVVEFFLGNSKLRINREDVTGFKNPVCAEAVVVDRIPTGCENTRLGGTLNDRNGAIADTVEDNLPAGVELFGGKIDLVGKWFCAARRWCDRQETEQIHQSMTHARGLLESDGFASG